MAWTWLRSMHSCGPPAGIHLVLGRKEWACTELLHASDLKPSHGRQVVALASRIPSVTLLQHISLNLACSYLPRCCAAVLSSLPFLLCFLPGDGMTASSQTFDKGPSPNVRSIVPSRPATQSTQIANKAGAPGQAVLMAGLASAPPG